MYCSKSSNLTSNCSLSVLFQCVFRLFKNGSEYEFFCRKFRPKVALGISGTFLTFCLTVISSRSGVLFLLTGLRLPDLLGGLEAFVAGLKGESRRRNPGPFPRAPLLKPPITCFGGSSFFVSIFFIGSTFCTGVTTCAGAAKIIIMSTGSWLHYRLRRIDLGYINIVYTV